MPSSGARELTLTCPQKSKKLRSSETRLGTHKLVTAPTRHRE